MDQRQPRGMSSLIISETDAITFLTACVSYLKQQNLLTDKDTNEYRIALAAFQPKPIHSSGSISILSHLSQACPGVFHLLLAVFGEAGLYTNLRRYCIRQQLQNIQRACLTLAENLRDSANLVFNRVIYNFTGHPATPEDRILVTETIFDTVDLLIQVVRELTGANETFFDFRRTLVDSLGGDKNALSNETLATSLEFRAVTHETLWGPKDRCAIIKIGQSIQNVSHIIYQFTRCLEQNDPAGKLKKSLQQVHACLLEYRRDEAFLIDATPDARDDWGTFDQKRRALATAMAGIADEIQNVSSHLREAVSALSTKVPQDAQRDITPIVVRNAVAVDLFRSGTNAQESIDAANKLHRYMELQKVSILDMIPAELPKIDQKLTKATLTGVQQRLQAETQLLSSKKEKLLSTSEGLQEKIKTISQSLVTVVVAAFFVNYLPSCGVKTAPKAEIIDYRPEIPFKDSPVIKPEPNQDQKTDNTSKK